jgi:hypothetical protein
MRAERQLQLSRRPLGRVLLHLLALRRDRKFHWHLAGIAREFSSWADF